MIHLPELLESLAPSVMVVMIGRPITSYDNKVVCFSTDEELLYVKLEEDILDEDGSVELELPVELADDEVIGLPY